MKKTISIILSVLIVLSALCFSLYTYTLNYNYTPEYIRLRDVLAGHTEEMTTLDEFETDYYTLLNSGTFRCLNFFEASSVLLASFNVPVLTFSSNEFFESETYNAAFYLCSIIIKNDKTYLYVSYNKNDKLSHSLYEVENSSFATDLNLNDFENTSMISGLIFDCFLALFLFAMKHGVILITIFVVIIIAIWFLNKQKRHQQE